MLIRHKKKFYQGLLMILSFAALFWAMLLPLFRDSDGNRLTSLQYADTVFNGLSKGSSWFIPEVQTEIKALGEHNASLEVRITRPDLLKTALLELEKCGIAARDSGDTLTFSGNLSRILEAATADSADMYNNNGAAVSSRYDGTPPLRVTEAWWALLNPCIKELQKQNDLAAARAVEQVVRKAVEPGNNFYGLPMARVSENILTTCGMLAFYVLYAIWYGFAIYHLFDGFGLLGEKQAVENVEESEI